jgi:hypothetical protein
LILGLRGIRIKNKKQEGTLSTAIAPTTKATTAIPEQTARLVEKSFADNIMRNRK